MAYTWRTVSCSGAELESRLNELERGGLEIFDVLPGGALGSGFTILARAPDTGNISAGILLPQMLRARPGESVRMTHSWSGGPAPRDLTVFVHFTDDAGNIRFQDDHAPPQPTTAWRGPCTYERTVRIPRDAAPGSYPILVGLYWVDGNRECKGWPVGATPGVTREHDRLRVGTLVVEK